MQSRVPPAAPPRPTSAKPPSPALRPLAGAFDTASAGSAVESLEAVSDSKAEAPFLPPAGGSSGAASSVGLVSPSGARSGAGAVLSSSDQGIAVVVGSGAEVGPASSSPPTRSSPAPKSELPPKPVPSGLSSSVLSKVLEHALPQSESAPHKSAASDAALEKEALERLQARKDTLSIRVVEVRSLTGTWKWCYLLVLGVWVCITRALIVPFLYCTAPSAGSRALGVRAKGPGCSRESVSGGAGLIRGD